MFPIPWNFPFRKKNGDLSTISDVINSGGGGGSDLPPHSIDDAGKLLGVDSAGKLEWTDDVSSEIQTLTNQLGDITQLATIDKSSAVAAINEVNTALGNKASTTDVNNKHKLTIETVSTSGWTADSTSQSGTTLYKKSISLNHVYVESPAVDIATSSGTGLPTAAQQTAYDLLQYVTVDGTTLYLYASAIPSTQFYIGVEGVD